MCLHVGTMPACELQPMMAFLTDYALRRPLNHFFFRDSKMCHFLYFTSQKLNKLKFRTHIDLVDAKITFFQVMIYYNQSASEKAHFA